MTEQLETESPGYEIEQIHDVVFCKQCIEKGKKVILSGRHRIEDMNKKGKVARARAADCDRIAKELGISHERAHWWVRRKANLQRTVSDEEQREEALAVAQECMNEGRETSEITAEVAKTLGVGVRRAQQLLPSDFKRTYEKEAEKYDEGPRAVGESVGDAPSAPQPLHGNDASQFRVSRHTVAAQLLETKMGYWGLHPDMDYATFPRYGEETKDGKTKSYTPDFWFPDKQLILEVEGEGSASKDDKRDEFFRAQGINVLHIPDGMAKKYGNEICEMLYVFLNPVKVK